MNIHLHLMATFRMSGDLHLLSPCAIRSSTGAP